MQYIKYMWCWHQYRTTHKKTFEKPHRWIDIATNTMCRAKYIHPKCSIDKHFYTLWYKSIHTLTQTYIHTLMFAPELYLVYHSNMWSCMGSHHQRTKYLCVFFFFFKFCSFCISCPSLTWWTHTPHPSLLPHYIPFSFSKVPVFCSSHRLPLWLFYPKCICSSFWIHCLAGLWQIRTTVCNRGGLGCFCIPLGVSVSLSRLTSLPSPVASLSLSIFLTLCLN